MQHMKRSITLLIMLTITIITTAPSSRPSNLGWTLWLIPTAVGDSRSSLAEECSSLSLLGATVSSLEAGWVTASSVSMALGPILYVMQLSLIHLFYSTLRSLFSAGKTNETQLTTIESFLISNSVFLLQLHSMSTLSTLVNMLTKLLMIIPSISPPTIMMTSTIKHFKYTFFWTLKAPNLYI